MALPLGSVADRVHSENNQRDLAHLEGFLELGFELRLEGEKPAEGSADSLGPRGYLSRLRYQGCLRFVECQSSLQIVGAEGLGEQWGQLFRCAGRHASISSYPLLVTFLRYAGMSSTIFPIPFPSSMCFRAAAVSSREKVSSMTGRKPCSA